MLVFLNEPTPSLPLMASNVDREALPWVKQLYWNHIVASLDPREAIALMHLPKTTGPYEWVQQTVNVYLNDTHRHLSGIDDMAFGWIYSNTT